LFLTKGTLSDPAENQRLIEIRNNMPKISKRVTSKIPLKAILSSLVSFILNLLLCV